MPSSSAVVATGSGGRAQAPPDMRRGRTEVVVQGPAYLASDDSADITEQGLQVEGGMLT